MFNFKTVSKLIRQKRRSLNLTIEELAKKANVSVSLVSRIEREDVTNISIKKLNDLAEALNLKVTDFFTNPELTGVYTLSLLKYLEKLPEYKREQFCQALLKMINL